MWTSVLAAAYVVFLVPPYFESFGKRLIKAPKLYFLDPALVVALTRQSGPAAALAGAMGGALFEGWVLSEVLKVMAARGRRADLYFSIEIKLTSTPTSRHLQPLERFKRLAGPKAADSGLLVCRVPQVRPLPGGNIALPWQQFPDWLDAELTATD